MEKKSNNTVLAH